MLWFLMLVGLVAAARYVWLWRHDARLEQAQRTRSYLRGLREMNVTVTRSGGKRARVRYTG